VKAKVVEDIQPATAPASGSEEDVNRLLKQSVDLVRQSLNEGALPSGLRQTYADTMAAILGMLTPAALTRHRANTSGYRFYVTHRELTEAFLAKYPAATAVVKGVLKGAFDRDGILHLNGGGGLFGRLAPLQEFFAHEMTHTIDGRGHEISNSEAWRASWEIEKGLMNANGMQNPVEGFAEFGQLLLGSVITRKQIRQALPKCLKVWEDFGL
jgi:hypothetical protein